MCVCVLAAVCSPISPDSVRNKIPYVFARRRPRHGCTPAVSCPTGSIRVRPIASDAHLRTDERVICHPVSSGFVRIRAKHGCTEQRPHDVRPMLPNGVRVRPCSSATRLRLKDTHIMFLSNSPRVVRSGPAPSATQTFVVCKHVSSVRFRPMWPGFARFRPNHVCTKRIPCGISSVFIWFRPVSPAA